MWRKTVVVTNVILNRYRGCFERIYVFSPPIDLDNTGLPATAYQQDVLRVGQDKTKTNNDHDEDHSHGQEESGPAHSSIGVTLVLGFIFMLIVDQI